MLPLGSDLLKPLHLDSLDPQQLQGELKKYYSEKLGLANSGIVIDKVVVKGNLEEQSKDKFYRAIHLTMLIGKKIPVEVQLMSKSMSIWHSWDHPKVYKTKYIDPDYVSQLKKYSLFWVKMIRAIEDLSGEPNGASQIKLLLASHGIESSTYPYSRGSIGSWLEWVDVVLSQQMKIWPNDRFLSSEGIISAAQKKLLFKELASTVLY